MGNATKKKKHSQIKSFLITLFFGIVLIIGAIISNQFPDQVNNLIEENLNISANTTNTISVNTVGNTVVSADSKLQIYYFDVGQADSELVIADGQVMLIDAGNNEDGQDVVNFIKGKGITKLNYVVGTHPHEDHIGGLDDVINSDLKIENLWMPKIQTNTKTFEDVLDAVKNKGLKVTAPNKGDSFEIGKAKCEVMTDSILNKDNLNLSSIVIRLEFENNSFLFMGDAETANEKTRTWMKTDVLKVGHHGSNTSSSEDFLKQINPTYAVIMAGKNNSYGLPKQKILDRLAKIGAKVYRTDEEGTIMMISNGNNIEVKENT